MCVADADGVQQEDPVILKALSDNVKVLAVVLNSNMFEHAHTENAVKGPV